MYLLRCGGPSQRLPILVQVDSTAHIWVLLQRVKEVVVVPLGTLLVPGFHLLVFREVLKLPHAGAALGLWGRQIDQAREETVLEEENGNMEPLGNS